MATRTKFLKQLEDMEALLTRMGEKAAADVRAAGLAAAGDHGAETGILEGRKAAERLRSQLENLCLDTMLMQQPLVGEDLRPGRRHDARRRVHLLRDARRAPRRP